MLLGLVNLEAGIVLAKLRKIDICLVIIYLYMFIYWDGLC